MACVSREKIGNAYKISIGKPERILGVAGRTQVC
jgi:hypothetical protein